MTRLRLLDLAEGRRDRSWTSEERAQVLRSFTILSDLFGDLDIDWGYSDHDAPWASFICQKSDDVIAHFVRLDDQVIVDFPTLDLRYSGRTLAEALSKITQGNAQYVDEPWVRETLAQYFRHVGRSTIGIMAGALWALWESKAAHARRIQTVDKQMVPESALSRCLVSKPVAGREKPIADYVLQGLQMGVAFIASTAIARAGAGGDGDEHGTPDQSSDQALVHELAQQLVETHFQARLIDLGVNTTPLENSEHGLVLHSAIPLETPTDRGIVKSRGELTAEAIEILTGITEFAVGSRARPAEGGQGAVGSGADEDAQGPQQEDPPAEGVEPRTSSQTAPPDWSAPGSGSYDDFLAAWAALAGEDANEDELIVGDGEANTLTGGAGDDTLLGLGGDDILDGNRGDDFLDGGAGDDTILGGAGDDTLFGGQGDDHLNGATGDDVINGNDGFDRLKGMSGNDLLHGGADGDRLSGGDGDDTVYGGSGDDTLEGGDGHDILFGGDGDDDFLVGMGDLFYHGGRENSSANGFDREFLALGDTILGKTTVRIDLTEGLLHAADIGLSAQLMDIENVDIASAGDDLIVGNAKDNDIRSKLGRDTIHLGQGGNDIVANFSVNRSDVADADTLTFEAGTVEFLLSTADDFYAAARILAEDGNPDTDLLIADRDLIFILDRDDEGRIMHSIRLDYVVRREGLSQDALLDHGAVLRQAETTEHLGNGFMDWRDNGFVLADHVIDHQDALTLSSGTVSLSVEIDSLLNHRSFLFSKASSRSEDKGHTSLYVEKDGQLVLRLEQTARTRDDIHLETDRGVIKAGQSYDIAFTFGEDGVRLFLDGREVASSTVRIDWLENEEDIVLGASAAHIRSGTQGFVKHHLDGTIEDFRILARQIEGDAVGAVSAEAAPVFDPFTVVEWTDSLDDLSG